MSSTTASDYFKAADGHRQAVKLLHPHLIFTDGGKGSTSLLLAFNNVLGFAIELYLKAFLAKHGYEAKQLSGKPFSHDLGNLYNAAMAKGFDYQEFALKDIIGFIGPSHAAYTYRYPKPDSSYMSINQMDLVFVVLDTMHAGMQADLA